MARGLIFSTTQAVTTTRLFSPSKSKWFIPLPAALPSSPLRCFCKCSNGSSRSGPPVDISNYKEAFFKRMAMAGLKPHHPIAVGVSGGPDSMALCVLAASWKMSSLNCCKESNENIDGLLAIIVDHGLRTESQDEANLVQSRVSKMGVRCEIARCEWLDGRPKMGHLQEAARDMRYQIFRRVCVQHGISFLLVAHHADDQAELFILRLSRNSGVLGLAGMAFTLQLFSSDIPHFGESSNRNSILLVRPLLEFTKDDMYKVCQEEHQEWVEDPTNLNRSFARNRIRMSLKEFSSDFRSELQALISACRKTRLYVDRVCYDLIHRAVRIIPQGYAVIDLEILDPSKVNEICLSKFITVVLQFISQRQRPVRGSTSTLLLDYIRKFPCKTSFTAAGCYLCAAPGSRGTKLLVCCSVSLPRHSDVKIVHQQSNEERECCNTSELEKTIVNGRSYSDCFVPDASSVQFLDLPSESILIEAQKQNLLNDSNYRAILALQSEETGQFRSKSGVPSDDADSKPDNDCSSMAFQDIQLKPGEVCYFMKRFLVSWNLEKDHTNDTLFPEVNNFSLDLKRDGRHHHYSNCVVHHTMVAQVRHMVDGDWLYLSRLSKCRNLEELQERRVLISQQMEQSTTNFCSAEVIRSAARALLLLKDIPIAARRSLPVLVSSQGLLLSIPNIGFKHCPHLLVSAEFKPRVPLGGGHSSFI